MRASVSAVIVAYRSAAHLPGLLADLEREGVGEVVVVDNASPDDSAAVASRAGARVVRETENRGFAAGVNAGLAVSQGDLLLIVNPDVRLAEGFLAALLDAHERHSEAVLGPVVRDLEGDLIPTRRSLPSLRNLLGEEVLVPEGARLGRWPQRAFARWEGYDRECEGPLLSGVCLLVPRKVLDATGPFDEEYFLYWEEVDWELRARACGYPTVLVPDALITHVRSASLGKHDVRRARLMARSTRRFLTQHLPPGHRLAALVLLSLGQLARGLIWTAAGLVLGSRAAARRRQHGAWLREAWQRNGTASADGPRASTCWLVEPLGRGGVAQYAVDVGRILGPEVPVRLATTTGGPAPGHSGPVEWWFPRRGPAPFDRPLAAIIGLVRAWRRPRRGDVAWVALGLRPTFERLLVAALRSSGCRVVATVHNRRPHEEDDSDDRPVQRVAARCDAVVVHTAAMERWGRDSGLPVVHLPFPPPAGGVVSPSGAHSRRTLGLHEEDLVLALIGNLRGYKGVDVLLEALGGLPAESSVRVVLAGQAGGWDIAAEARRCGVSERVVLLEGYLPHGELLDVLALADAAVLPYRRIDHSGAGSLVASRGLPAVASDLPGLREVFGDAAVYVTPGSVSSLRAALLTLPAALRSLPRPQAANALPSPGRYVELVRAVSSMDEGS
jgi:N-acetylglucosaminyl-diphospho-decaprenol L-rhamnosyltransferase